MSEIFNNMRRAMNTARKSGDKDSLSILSYHIGKLMGIAEGPDKALNDQQVIIATRKEVKNLRELGNDQSIKEADILENFLPEPLTDDEIRTVLAAGNFKTMKDFMQFMKDHYSGLYDGKKATEIWKNMQ